MHSPLRAGTWRHCSGLGSTTARGMTGRAVNAAQGGHLEVLRWSGEHVCQWDSMACALRCGRSPGGAAVGAGARLLVIKWSSEAVSRDGPETKSNQIIVAPCSPCVLLNPAAAMRMHGGGR